MPQYLLTLSVAYEAKFKEWGIEGVTRFLEVDDRVASFARTKEGGRIMSLRTKDIPWEKAIELSSKLILDFGLIVKGSG